MEDKYQNGIVVPVYDTVLLPGVRAALRLADDSQALEAALSRVAEARRLVAEVARGLPPPAEGSRDNPMQRARAEGLLTGPEPLRLADAFLREHFVGS